MKAGASDCLEKSVGGRRLLGGVNDLLRQTIEEPYLSQPALTPMEVTVLCLILEGKTNHEAARILHRSPRTVEVHRKHIMHKLGASSVIDLVKIAASMGLLR
jgi:DNA-binding NarL/FixJ family response regulator